MVGTGSVAADADTPNLIATRVIQPQAAAKDVDTTHESAAKGVSGRAVPICVAVRVGGGNRRYPAPGLRTRKRAAIGDSSINRVTELKTKQAAPWLRLSPQVGRG